MKKILLASTMLVSAAGFAAADVTLSGSARMGVVSAYNSNAGEVESTFSSRVHVKFTGSGTTDGGLAFGGSFEAQDTQEASSGNAGSVYISGAFGKISMGGVDSGDKAAVGQLASVGYTGLGSFNSVNYAADGGAFTFAGLTDFEDYIDNAGGSKVLYTYTAGDLSVSASTGQISNYDNGDRSAYGVGVSYKTGDLTLAVGFGSSDVLLDGEYDLDGSVTDTSASATYVMGTTTVKAIYQDKELEVSSGDVDAAASAVSMGLSVQHTIDALTLTAYDISTKLDGSVSWYDGYSDGATSGRYGIGASYNLGGGASFAAGWAHIENFDGGIVDEDLHADGHDVFDAGVNFSF